MPSLPATHRFEPISFRRTAVASDMSRARESSGRTKETSFQQRNHGDVVPSPAKCESASHLNQQGGEVPKKDGIAMAAGQIIVERDDQKGKHLSVEMVKKRGPFHQPTSGKRTSMIPSGNLT